MLEAVLQKIGLNSNEAVVYMASLKVGTQHTGMLAKETGMARADVINAIHTLMARGFMSKFIHDNKEYFTAAPLRVVLKILEEQNNITRSSITSLRRNLPLFDAFVNPSFVKPEISFYEGKEGIIAAYEDTLTSKTEILAIASIDSTETTLPRYVPKYYQRRKAAGIVIKAIFPDTPMARKRHAKDQQELRVSRLIPADQYFFDMEINIYDDKVAYFSLKEKLAVVIESAGIASNMRHMFNLCWRMAEHYNSNCL